MVAAGAPALLVGFSATTPVAVLPHGDSASGRPPPHAQPGCSADAGPGSPASEAVDPGQLMRACLGACAATPLGMPALWRAGLPVPDLAAAVAEGMSAWRDPADAAHAPLSPDAPPARPGKGRPSAGARPGPGPAARGSPAPPAVGHDAALQALLAGLGACPGSGDAPGSPGEPGPGPGGAVAELERAHAVEVLLAEELPAVLGAFRSAGLSAGAAAAAWLARRAGQCRQQPRAALASLRAARAEVQAAAARGGLAGWAERWVAGAPSALA
jgi:hypothetical protein